MPPELCCLVGIPPEAKADPLFMADLRSSCVQEPNERVSTISELTGKIAEGEGLKNWEIEVSLTPDTIDAKVLQRPRIMRTPNFEAQIKTVEPADKDDTNPEDKEEAS